ncbi:hypothetical protein F5Y17DRAFT_456225 [Xylariaceae sp. FL0594]|nr:hypothetical protein F5Y17DRAFT_456225 [Xylariaceae sp. FL0594]
MLVRLLYRPLLRSVAAAWQPATTSAFLNQNGNRRCYNTTSNDNDNDTDVTQPPGQSVLPTPEAAKKEKKSLFEELFPDEAKKLAKAKLKRESELDPDPDAPRNSWAAQLFEEPPRPGQSLLEELGDEDLEDDDEEGEREEGSLPTSTAPGTSESNRGLAVLVLAAASKHLNESDFMRLGLKGKHLEGWTGGILKVIQARDQDTLEPKGHYHIFFETHEAAMVYQDRIEELWKLGKRFVPRAHHGRAHMMLDPLPGGLKKRTQNGEEVKKLIRSFTLVPPSQRREVAVSRMLPDKVEKVYRQGSIVDALAAVTGSRFLVMIRVDGGRLSLPNLRRAIEHDGQQRNLPWRITDLYQGILPFGRSVIKSNEKFDQLMSNLDDMYSGKYARDSGGEDGASDRDLYNKAMGQPEEVNEKNRKFPRFIIPFEDKAEAHRFLRNWHRRELTIQMGGREINEPIWEESRIINASFLW